MNPLDYVILGLVAVALVGAFLWARRRKKQGKGCCGNCGQCSGCNGRK
ncbi:MAG: FeoB-associated Cys-rich membrane protein [Clostridia bacterium]|nr:FeoB-associated Cys-rich membrane protein [Clostridia bacterium]